MQLEAALCQCAESVLRICSGISSGTVTFCSDALRRLGSSCGVEKTREEHEPSPNVQVSQCAIRHAQDIVACPRHC